MKQNIINTLSLKATNGMYEHCSLQKKYTVDKSVSNNPTLYINILTGHKTYHIIKQSANTNLNLFTFFNLSKHSMSGHFIRIYDINLFMYIPLLFLTPYSVRNRNSYSQV